MSRGPELGDFKAKGAVFSYQTLGEGSGPTLIWAHGWGLDHKSLLPLASSLEKDGYHILLDLPGFGKSPEPSEVWGTEDYADAVAEWIKTQSFGKIIWVSHSFGGRVGLQLAARHPELVAGLFSIASAGLRPKRRLHQKLILKTRIVMFKITRKILGEKWAMRYFSNVDYSNTSGVMRSIFVKAVNKDLAQEAATITCPVKLVYGTQDTEAPPNIGERLAQIIPNAEMVHLEGQDHYTILSQGRHQVAHLLKQFITDLNEEVSEKTA